MQLKNVKYILSAPSKQFWIPEDRKEVCIVGRSNVGKSTLINKITNNNSMAKVSKTPGYTKYINFFDVNQTFYLADTPGYGYAKASWTRDESFANMMHEYLYDRSNLICVILVVDAKIGFTNDDILMLQMAEDAKKEVKVVASKTDKTNQSLRHKLSVQAKELLGENAQIIFYSSLDNRSVDNVVEMFLNTYNN